MVLAMPRSSGAEAQAQDEAPRVIAERTLLLQGSRTKYRHLDGEAGDQPNPEGWDSEEPETESVIGKVEIRVGDIFDPTLPGEDRFLFRLANRLHRKTREEVIRNQLLFEEGDRYEVRVLEESERALREDRYLKDAEIYPVHSESGEVDLDVVVKDVWTLNAGVGFGRGGGVGSRHFQVQDYNLFGTGKGLTLRQASDVDRTSSELIYSDQNLLGSRWQLNADLSNNSDGSRYGLEVERPFFSLDSRWAVGLAAVSEDRVDSLYDLGAITGQFRHQRELFEIRGGLSRGLIDSRAKRWSTGLTYRRDLFDLVPVDLLASASQAATLPRDRTLAYPWIAYDSLPDEFLTARNQDRMDRVEDLALGCRFHARLGFASTAFGSSEEAAIFDTALGAGRRFSGSQTWLVSTDLGGRWGARGAENVKLRIGTSYYWRNFGKNLFFGSLEGSLARNLDPENQLLLGGDSGLRGYPLRYQTGDRSFLLTLEQRFFTDLNPWKLFRVGAVVFFDAGGVWSNEETEASNLGLLRDIGVGLRLGSTRSGRGSVVHLDVAFPLDGDGSIRSLQWLVKSKESF